MRISRLPYYLLILVCVTSGCSQTGGVRPYSGSGSNTRTVASVGDNPLPIVTGEPGSSLRASTEELDLPSSTGSRISGRVYDESGKPVSNAKVRLAVGSSPGGKINYATTDQTGWFTLRGLRANSSYTVIAEYQGEDGLMTGRVDAEAPRTNVSISLQPRDAISGQNRAAIRAWPNPESSRSRTSSQVTTKKPVGAAGLESRTRTSSRQTRMPLRSLANQTFVPHECHRIFRRPRSARAGMCDSLPIRTTNGRHRQRAQGTMTKKRRPDPRCPMNPLRKSTMKARIRCRRRSRTIGSVPRTGAT